MLAVLLLASCEHPAAPDVETVSVTYLTSPHTMDVTYCREDGSLAAEYGVYKFEKTLEIPVGGKVCISAQKLEERNNIYARVYIKSGADTIFYKNGPMSASVSGYLPGGE